MADVTAAVERRLAASIARAVPAPWGSKNRTAFVELADDRHLVLQQYADATTARFRLAVARNVAPRLIEHGIPVARVIDYDLDGAVPWAVFERMPGEPAYVAAGDDLSGATFPGIARDMGLLARRIRELDPAGLELPRLWADPDGLAAAAAGWLADLSPYLSRDDIASTRAILDSLADLFGNRPAVVCHGDFGPQNVLAIGERVTGLLDLEDMRLADSLLDVAWWAWLVRAHTPLAFVRAWRGFLDASAVSAADEDFEARLTALIVVRLLETADSFRRAVPAKHAGWARRLSATLEWRGSAFTIPAAAGRPSG